MEDDLRAKALECAERKEGMIILRVLVTDKGVWPLNSGIEEDRQGTADTIRDVFLCNKATVCEVREISITIPHLPPPAAMEAGKTVKEIELPPEIRAVVEKAVQEHRVRSCEEAISALMRAFPAGRFEVYDEKNTRGIRRIE